MVVAQRIACGNLSVYVILKYYKKLKRVALNKQPFFLPKKIKTSKILDYD